MDVPLEDQTKESVIAYIQSLEKYQKQLEEIVKAARDVRSKYGNVGSNHKDEIYAVRNLSLAINKMDEQHERDKQ